MGMAENLAEPQVNCLKQITALIISLPSSVLITKKCQVNCPECGEDIDCKEKLPIHLKTVHGYRKPFLCDPPCQKAYATRYYLGDHQSRRNCLRNQKFQCQFCDAKFGTEIGRKGHHRKGKCEKKYQCLECENRPYFSKVFDLKNHKGVTHGKCDSTNDFSMQLPAVVRYVRH